MGSPTVVEIVADGGAEVGFGHIGRCLAVWDELRVPAVFCVDDHLARRHLAAQGIPVAPAGAAPVALIDRLGPTDEETVRRLHEAGQRVCLLDDPGTGRVSAELVVDPPTGLSWPPAAGRRLAGFEHALIRREIRAVEKIETRGHVLLTMGGSDPANLTPALAEALVAAGLETEVALGPGYTGEPPEAGTILKNAAEWPPALAGAAVAVTGFGQTLLEAAHLGVPAIAVVSRPEHLDDAKAFAVHGTTSVVDMTASPEPATLAAAVRSLLRDSPLREAMSRRGRELIDGHGAARVAHAIETLL
jgi:spore coat polysaccharide biosynthesis predicted glycosyltransferase SpsG